jgi:hypothetical protein
MTNNKQQTAVELLFLEFKSLSKVSRDAGDEQTANLIDFLCEREQQAKEMEKEHELNLIKFTKEIFELGKSHFSYAIITNEEILELYNETSGGNK